MKKKIESKERQRFNLPLLAGVLVILVLFFARLFYKNDATKATGADVYFEPRSIKLTQGENKSVSLVLDSHGKKIAFTRIAIKYDAEKIHLATDLVGNPNLSNNIEKTGMDDANSEGKAVLVIAANPTDVQPSGVFELATFMVRPLPDDEDEDKETDITLDTSNMQIVDATAQELYIKAGKLQIKL